MRNFFLTLIAYMTMGGFALAQTEEDDLSGLYDEIAVGTEQPADTGDDVSAQSTEPSSSEAENEPGSELGPEPEPTQEPAPEPSVEPETQPISQEVQLYEEDTKQQEPEKEEIEAWNLGGTRRHLSFYGPTGLYQIIEAGSGEKGTFAGGFHGAYFKYTSYLISGDEHSSMWSGLNLRVTPFSFLELFLGAQTFSNYNNHGSPTLTQSIGNVRLGAKGFFSPTDGITIAGLFGTYFKNPVGEVKATGEGTSFDLALMTSFDLYEMTKSVPLRLHLNVGYLFDQSAMVIEDLEWSNGGCSQDVDGDGQLDFDGCLGPIDRFSLDINRNDQFRVGVGVDALLPYFSPLVEYWFDIPVNRQGFTCPQNLAGSNDSCMAIEGIRGTRQWVTLGIRILPPIESLAFDLGVDIGVTGWGPTVHELSAQDPYRVLFGLSYGFHVAKKGVGKEACPQVEPTPPPLPVADSREGVIIGYVFDKTDSEKAIPAAKISYNQPDLDPQVSDSYGKFRSYPFPLGDVSIEISAEGFETGSFNVNIPSPEAASEKPGRDDLADPYDVAVEVDFPLTPIASRVMEKSALVIRVVDEEGKPVPGAVVAYEGPENGKETALEEGKIETEIQPGAYLISAQKDGYLSKASNINVAENSLSDFELRLSKVPEISNVVIKKRKIIIKRKVHFTNGSDVIKEDSFSLLNEVAAVLISHTELKKIEIQGHTDNNGTRSYNMDLSERRAKSVANYLVQAGVESSRLESKGYGPTKPIAPNITNQGRARNRRVEFYILERDESSE